MILHNTTDIKSLKSILTSLFETYPDGCILFSVEGRILYSNTTFARMTGYSKSELNATAADSLFTDDMFVSIMKSLKSKPSSGSDFRMESRCKRKDSPEFPVELTMKIVHTGDSMAGYVIVRDITRERTVCEENANLRDRLSHAQTMETVGQLAGGISHYFNNVFTGILGNLNLAEIDASEQQASLIRKTAGAVDRARCFARQLLSMSRKSSPVFEPTDVRAIIEDVEIFANLTFDRRIKITVDIPGPLQGAMADTASIHNVILNLCVNARDAIEEKLFQTHDMSEHRITIKAATVTIDESHLCDQPDARKGRFVRISVSDTGCGIDEETKKHMFEQFFTTKEQGKGTGLGLATAQETIRQHGGWIEVSSELGRGSEFTVYLPAVAMKKKAAAVTKISDLPKGTETILFVDDEEIVRTFGVMALERQGYTVIAASDGQEGLDLFIREREKIGLVILDLVLPKLPGKEVLKKIRLIDREVKIIISSGQEFELNKHIFNEYMALDYIMKPFDIADLTLSVRNALDRA